MRGLTLDTGALIALERGDERVTALIDRVRRTPEAIIHVPAAAVAQAFRDGPRQVALNRLLKAPQTCVVALDEQTAHVVGLLLGLRGGSDVVDASVVVCARRHRQAIVTSDPGDLRRLDPRIALETV